MTVVMAPVATGNGDPVFRFNDGEIAFSILSALRRLGRVSGGALLGDVAAHYRVRAATLHDIVLRVLRGLVLRGEVATIDGAHFAVVVGE